MGSQQLTFDGDLELIDIGGGSEDGYTIEAVEGMRFGNPVPVEAVIASFLRDGSIVAKTGDENREMSIPVRVSGPDGVALAAGEKRLNLATGKRTTLAWTPPDGLGPTTVFEVLTSSLDRVEDDWDLDEVRGVRTYVLRLVCLPFGRSVDKVTDDADTPATSGSTLDACDSATGWAINGFGGAISTDAAVKVEGAASVKVESGTNFYNTGAAYGFDFTSSELWVVKSASWATGAGGYVLASIRPEWAQASQPDWMSLTPLRVFMTTANNGRVEVSPVSLVSQADGFVQYGWPVDASDTVTAVEFRVHQWRRGSTTIEPFVWFDAILLAGSASTDHQIVKTFDVEGSARGPGSLHISSQLDSVALGQVFAMTVPADDVADGFQPDLRRWVTSGVTTADVTALHDSYFGAGAVFDVPVSMLQPGPYTVYGLLQASSLPMGSTITAELLPDGVTSVGPTSVASLSDPVGFTDWGFGALGTVFLPPVPMENASSDAVVRLTASGNARVADMYLVPASADVSIMDCGSGSVSVAGAASHAWIDSPTPDQPQGGWWRGPVAERVNSRKATLVSELRKRGLHVFTPGRMNAYVVSTEAAGPRVTLESYKWWFGNAAS